MKPSQITFDTNYIYVDQKKFFPILDETGTFPSDLEAYNGVTITVDCSDSSDFNWDEAKESAEKATHLGKWILWKLDFGFEEGKVFLEDSASFYSKTIAIEEFSKFLYAPFEDSTLGACLFWGSADVARYFVWTDEYDTYFQEYIEEIPSLAPGLGLGDEGKKLFAADVFSQYLQRLASQLPESLIPFCLLDVSSISQLSFLCFLLSKDRFQHLALGLKKSKLPLGCLSWQEGACLGGWIGRGSPYFAAFHDVSLGVCIPLESTISQPLLEEIDLLLEYLKETGIAFRVISEMYLNEEWDGIDDLIVFPSALSAQGRRKLTGFEVAGGRVIQAKDYLPDEALV